MRYTLRNIPAALDDELRRRARAAGKSLNAVAIEALRRGAKLGEEAPRQRDLGDIAGTWTEDDEFDQAVKDQHRVDRRLWR
jgi:plasmid stability protein